MSRKIWLWALIGLLLTSTMMPPRSNAQGRYYGGDPECFLGPFGIAIGLAGLAGSGVGFVGAVAGFFGLTAWWWRTVAVCRR
ncbi:MAG TPA: hypothetical protein VF944_07405 [Candidatus Bathyarchaeia archaeon]